MTQGGTKKIKMKVNKATGVVVEVVDEKNDPATPVTQTELQQIYQSEAGVKHVGTILYTHSSPG